MVKAALTRGRGEDTRPLPAEEGQVAQPAGRGVEIALGPGLGLHREDSDQTLARPQLLPQTLHLIGSLVGPEVKGTS